MRLINKNLLLYRILQLVFLFSTLICYVVFDNYQLLINPITTIELGDSFVGVYTILIVFAMIEFESAFGIGKRV